MSVGFTVILIIIIVLSSLGIVFITMYNELVKCNVKLEDAEEKISKCLTDKYDILKRMINIEKKNATFDEKLFNDFNNITEDVSNFDKDKTLTKTSRSIITICDDNEKISKNRTFKKLKEQLKDTEEKLIALRTFYNKYTKTYNALINKFPSNIVARFLNYDVRVIFEGKNLTNENIKDFKI